MDARVPGLAPLGTAALGSVPMLVVPRATSLRRVPWPRALHCSNRSCRKEALRGAAPGPRRRDQRTAPLKCAAAADSADSGGSVDSIDSVNSANSLDSVGGVDSASPSSGEASTGETSTGDGYSTDGSSRLAVVVDAITGTVDGIKRGLTGRLSDSDAGKTEMAGMVDAITGTVDGMLRMSLTGGRLSESDSDEVKAAPAVDPEVQRLTELVGRLVRATREGEARAAADAVVGRMPQDSRKSLLQALFAAGGSDSATLFEMADMNSDGVLDTREFSQFLEATRAANAEDASVRPLSQQELSQLFYRSAIGCVGFGIVDNSVMLLAGDLIESTLGRSFGFSVLLSAGLGNAVSDVIGTVCKESIEGASAQFMPQLNVSSYQMATRAARWAEMAGSCTGITVGCFLGLTPLLFLGKAAGPCQGGTPVASSSPAPPPALPPPGPSGTPGPSLGPGGRAAAMAQALPDMSSLQAQERVSLEPEGALVLREDGNLQVFAQEHLAQEHALPVSLEVVHSLQEAGRGRQVVGRAAPLARTALTRQQEARLSNSRMLTGHEEASRNASCQSSQGRGEAVLLARGAGASQCYSATATVASVAAEPHMIPRVRNRVTERDMFAPFLVVGCYAFARRLWMQTRGDQAWNRRRDS